MRGTGRRSCGRSSFWKKFQRIRCETKPPRCSAIRSPCSRYPSIPARSFPYRSRLSRGPAHNRSNPSHIRLSMRRRSRGASPAAYYVTDRFVRTGFFPLSLGRSRNNAPTGCCGNPIREGWMDGWNARTRFRREQTRPTSSLPPRSIALATRVTRHRISAGRLETTIAGQGGRPSSTCHNSIESLLRSSLFSLSPS